jgi:N-acylglucosamine 2-epimerase
MYTNEELDNLAEFYKNQLINDTVPFWFPRSYDYEFGGYLLMRDYDGTLIDTDKAVWIQGRASWLLSTLYNTVEPRQEWLEGARLGYEFIRDKCFNPDGKMYFHVDREGNPIRMRRYFFSETFAVIASAAYAKASGSGEAATFAREMFTVCLEYANGKRVMDPKFEDTRPSKGIGIPMIMCNTAQQLRETIGDPRCDGAIMSWIKEIEENFVKDDIRCVMEQVSLDGDIIDHIDGRTLNPGHAIEGAWFILHEAIYRGMDQHLIDLGLRMLDYMWERGWDEEHGGILYFRDVYNKPVQEYWQDMKFWWPQNETIIACLLAYLITKDEKYSTMHKLIHDYAYKHFHDSEHGEWFGYLHKDGSIAQTAKCNMFKGPFHLPRQEWYCWSVINKFKV